MIGSDDARGKTFANAAEYGHLYIQTEKTIYNPGETITGNIYLQAYQEISAGQIVIKLKGKEIIHLFEGEPLAFSKHITKAERPAFIGPPFTKGQYVFPFNFLLPENIPGSFFQQGSKFLASIIYYLEASITPIRIMDPKIKYKHRFVVTQVPKSITGEQDEIRTNMTSCCFPKGFNILSVRPEMNSYTAGDIAQIAITFDNTQCSLNNRRITATLYQNLTLNFQGKTFERRYEKVHRELEGVPARRIRQDQLSAMNLLPFQSGDYWDIKVEARQENSLRQYLRKYLEDIEDVSQSMNCTARGTLITSEYFIEVRCEMEGSCVIHPEIVIPLELAFPVYKDSAQSWPPNWNPQIMNNTNIGRSIYGQQERLSDQPPSRESSNQNRSQSMQYAIRQIHDDNSSMPLTSSDNSGLGDSAT